MNNYEKFILSFSLCFLLCSNALSLGSQSEHESLDFFYLNAFGESKTYQVFAYRPDGIPASPLPVVTPKSIGASIQHVAWPSAVRVGNEILLFVSAFESGSWKRLYLLKSRDGLNFGFAEIAFEASKEEPFGIGPAHVTYDARALEPFILFYQKRGPQGPGSSINLARSRDGKIWKRYGEMGDGLAFALVDPEGIYSTENPARISNGCSCSSHKIKLFNMTAKE